MVTLRYCYMVLKNHLAIAQRNHITIRESVKNSTQFSMNNTSFKNLG